MTTEHLAIYLAEQIEAVYEAPHLPRQAAAELRRLYEENVRLESELEGTAQRNRDIYGQLDKAEAEIDRLRAALEMAVRQNEHDMLMTGEELRQARAALTGEKT
jgi:uncharacterized protein Yka (UPF0111/DUF47 family)